MKNFTSTQAKTHFGEFMQVGMKEGVCITKNGRPAGYFVPASDYLASEAMVARRPARNGIAETLAQYSVGAVPRLAAMKQMGTDDYGVLLRLLNAAGFPHPQVKTEERAQMLASFASALAA
jgi:prevent-host-death family protein